jgi:hypothetical protein
MRIPPGIHLPMELQKIDVECRGGHPHHDDPIAFTYRGRRHVVREIVDRWYEGLGKPGKVGLDYYRVRTDFGHFILRYNTLFDAWAIVTGP